MDDLEALVIYKQYVELIYYTLSILLKYPKSERFSLAQDIKNATYDGLKDIIYAQKEYDKKKRLSYLNELDANLKIIKVLIRVSHKKKYINSKNYTADRGVLSRRTRRRQGNNPRSRMAGNIGHRIRRASLERRRIPVPVCENPAKIQGPSDKKCLELFPYAHRA